MRPLTLLLCLLLVLVQYPLWFGERGWREVWRLSAQLDRQQQVNARAAVDNAALEAELRDLAEGRQAVEERARYDLGMVAPGEIFVQINEAGDHAGPRIQTADASPRLR
jgi:cell division protein FtsB